MIFFCEFDCAFFVLSLLFLSCTGRFVTAAVVIGGF